MNSNQDIDLLAEIEQNLTYTRSAIVTKISSLKEFGQKLTMGLKTWYKGSEDIEVVKYSIIKNNEDMRKLEELKDSPYFFRADIKFPNETKTTTIYISKHTFGENKIYSWVSPIAKLRYQNPGITEYEVPGGEQKIVELFRKDNYLIRQGQIHRVEIQTDSEKKVLLDDKFSESQGFGLSEIIEKLDSYQDEIIRMNPYGSMLISGAAGSGKTTLALHRIAYLIQNPDTARDFPSRGVIIFVQDELTKDYFGSILPKLGLSSATINTFAEWVFNQLGIKNLVYVNHDISLDYAKLMYAKSKALKQRAYRNMLSDQDSLEMLKSAYMDYFDEDTYLLFTQQQAARQIDRFDLCMLMLHRTQTTKPSKNYQLILVDEAENYLTEQLQLIKGLVSSSSKAIMYIGDLVQQTLPFTIKTWDEIGENFQDRKRITLPKVYRITEQIRNYLIHRGYEQDTTVKLKSGPEVIELNSNILQITEQLQSIKTSHSNTIGILSNDLEVIAQLEKLQSITNVRVMSIFQAQGVEFEKTILIFKNYNFKTINDPELKAELIKVQKDLFYVGATRAKRELIVYELD